MVVSAIFVLLSSVVLAGNSRFGSVIVLQNLAHDIGLSVRQAQVYGIAVRRYDNPSAPGAPGVFTHSYGMHFSPGTSYELFADVNGNGIWEPGETVDPITLRGGYAITDICAPSTTCGVSRVDIVFRRPEPDACISTGGTITYDLNGVCTAAAVQRAIITIASPRGDQAEVLIDASGQISVR